MHRVILIPGRDARRKHGNLGPTAWNERVAKRLVTRPIKNGKLNMWPEHELEAIARAHIRGYDNTAIRLLVEDLEAQREQFCVDPAAVCAELVEA